MLVRQACEQCKPGHATRPRSGGLSQRQRDWPTTLLDRLVDGQADFVRVVGVGNVAVRFGVIANAIDKVVDLGIERMVIHVCRVRLDGG